MRAAIFDKPGSITVGDRPDPVIHQPTDAVVRVVLACVCGSDLWYYRGDSPFAAGPIGHEFIGVVEDTGADISTLRRGDLVIAPFAFSDGTCPNCQNGITTACMNGGFWAGGPGLDGGQGEAVRVPLADTTLVTVPGSGHSDAMLRSLLTLSDVMATGHHAAVCAQVRPGQTVAVVGDGAVGLSAVLAAKRMGAERTGQSMQTAIDIARAGSMVGFVGVPHGVELPIQQMFHRTVGVRGGGAPVRVYLPELLMDVLAGTIDPGRVLDHETDLEHVGEAYAAMDERRAIKSLVRVGSV
jgi:threonine dehydrogenase-like Zn-dependent dehydrogenase